ncbi:MAG TPA: hypothetical protein VFF06_02840 [Polyangia bacterium]|nr:hypothetical protein [Polyangia bacterium]
MKRAPAKRRWLRGAITIALVVMVGAALHFGVEKPFEHFDEKLHERALAFNQRARQDIFDLVPLQLGRVFFWRLVKTPCECGGALVDCDDAEWRAWCVLSPRLATAVSPRSIGFRLWTAAGHTYRWVAERPWPNIVVFVFSLLVGVLIAWDSDHVVVSLLGGVLVASVVALALWALAWLLSGLVVLLLPLILVIVWVLHHYLVHPLEARLARWLGLEEHEEHE